MKLPPNTWFTADTHFGHKNIIKYCDRPFDSCKKMDNFFIHQINKYIDVQDWLIIVGDFASPRAKFTDYEHYRNMINCKNVILIWGNHDPKPTHIATRHCVKKLFTNSFDKITIKIENTDIHLNHEPVAIWDKQHFGSFHLYGHTHAKAETWINNIMPGCYAMDAGIDNAAKLLGTYKPFSWDFIKNYMSNKSGFGITKQELYSGEN